MAYVKNIWEDRVVEYPNRYKDQNGDVYTFTRYPGEVTSQGTIPTKEKMDNIENGIEQNDNDIGNLEELNTTEKGNLVDVINEVNNNIIVDYVDNQEIKTNEKINGKTVYAKRLTFTTPASDQVTIEHGIKDIDQIWVDYSNSFFRSTTNYNTYTLPIIRYGEVEDKVYCLVDNINIIFLVDTGWGEQWIKNIVLKYTKTTD